MGIEAPAVGALATPFVFAGIRGSFLAEEEAWAALLWKNLRTADGFPSPQDYPIPNRGSAASFGTFSTPRRQMGKIWPALIKQHQKMVVRLGVLCLAVGGLWCHFLA